MNKSNLVIFLGPPGSGKGSLSQLCTKHLGWKQFSTGSLCRKLIAENTELGKQIDFFIKSGKLIEDEVVVAMIQQVLIDYAANNPDEGIILDGFPRTVPQAKLLYSLVNKLLNSYHLHIVRLCASDEVIKERLLNRYTCENKDCQAIYSLPLLLASSSQSDKEYKCEQCLCKLIRRSDDHVDTISERLAIYRRHEQALIDFYNEHGESIKNINVETPLQLVFENFTKLVEA